MTWISCNNMEYHYYTNHSSICKLFDILKNPSQSYSTSENPDEKCPVCKAMLRSRQTIKISTDKIKHQVKEQKFLQKYRESPVGLITRYISSPENHPLTLKQISQNLSCEIDDIDIKDILADAIVQGKITCKDEKFYPIIPGVIQS